MQDVQQVFNELEDAKQEKKEINREYKDILEQNADYQEICEKIKELQEIKKQHEFSAQNDMGMRWERFEELKGEIKKLKEMISDISLTTMMNGETVEVRDQYDRLYEPKYNVDFKKVN